MKIGATFAATADMEGKLSRLCGRILRFRAISAGMESRKRFLFRFNRGMEGWAAFAPRLPGGRPAHAMVTSA
jgi:hypothetical protein